VSFGLTAAGFVPKRLADCKTDLIAELRSRFGQNVDIDDASIMGQLASILAEREASIWELVEEVLSQRSVGNASGMILRDLLALAGTELADATYSTVVLTLGGVGGTLVPAGSRSSDGTTEWIHDDDVTIPGTTTASPATTGPIRALAGTITTRVTAIAGWSSVTNADDASPGALAETEALGRKRLVTSFRASGGSSLPGLLAALLRATDEGGAGCTDAVVIQNESDDPDVDGRPGHSVEAICVDGLEADIAAVLWASVPIGIEMYGSETTSVVDAAGDTQTVKYSRQTDVDIHILVEYERDTDDGSFPVDTDIVLGTAHDATGTGELEMRTAILDAALSRVGKDVVPWQLKQAIETSGLREVTIYVGLSTLPTNALPLTLPANERPIYDSTRIKFKRLA
jgi:hypothetical protein